MSVKKRYTSPTLIEFGDVTRITQGSATGTALDRDFPVGTPFEDLTFS
jgi:hypothetical protein